MNAECPRCRTVLALTRPGDVSCGACGEVFTALPPKDAHICRTCGTIGQPAPGDWSGAGGFVLQCGLIIASLIALVAWFPAGVLLCVATFAFGLKRLRDQRALCPGCGRRDLIPLGTPAGQKLTEQFHA